MNTLPPSERLYKTTDFLTMVILRYLGFTNICINSSFFSERKTMAFARSSKLEDALRSFFGDEISVNPRRFYDCLRDTKRELSSN